MDRWDLKPERRSGKRIWGGGWGPGKKLEGGAYRLVDGKWIAKEAGASSRAPAVSTRDGAYFDRGLCGWVKNAAHRREIMKKRNLVELGNG